MRKVSLALAVLGALLFSAAAEAQNITVVTGTVTDPNGLPYANGTIQAQLIPAGITPTLPPPCQQQTQTPCSVNPFTSASLDITGKFSMNLASNAVLSPGGTKWQFTVSGTSGLPPPVGTGTQTFSAQITISGASQSLSTTLSALAPALTVGISGGACPAAGTNGDLQEKNNTACAAAPIHDTGAVLQFTRSVDPLNAENIAQKPNPSVEFVDAVQGQVGTDCLTAGPAACLYFETAFDNLWSYNPSSLNLQGGTIFIYAPSQSHINLNSSSTTVNGGWVMRIIGSGDPNYAANCSSSTLPTCTIGGQLWYKMPPTGLKIQCVAGSLLSAAIPSTFGKPCYLNFSIITSGVGTAFSADGIAAFSNSTWPAYMDGYSSNGIYGDTSVASYDAPIITNSVFTEGNGPGPWMPPVAYANTIDAVFTNDYFGVSSFGQSLYQVCNITAAVRSGNVATFTCAAAHNFPATFFGQTIYLPVKGVTDTTFNKFAGAMTVVDSTHLSMLNSGPNATSSGGAIYGPASYAIYAVGGVGSANLMGLNRFNNSAMNAGGALFTSGSGGGPGAPTAQLNNMKTEGMPISMASETTNALNYSGGIDDQGGNSDSDPQQTCTPGVNCGGGITVFGVNGGLFPGVAQAMQDIASNCGGIPTHSQFRAYCISAIPNSTPEIRDAAGFFNADVRASWPGLSRSGAPVEVLYSNQCPTPPAGWTGTTVTAKPSYLDVTSSGTGAGQVAAAVTFCSITTTLQNGDRLIVGGALNAQSAIGFPSNDVTMVLTASGTNAWLFEPNGVEGGGLAQTYTFGPAAGQGEWEIVQKFLKAYTGTAASASYTLTFTGAADGTHIMQYAFPKIEVIPAADAPTDEEVAMRARYEALFSSACGIGLCNPKTGQPVCSTVLAANGVLFGQGTGACPIADASNFSYQPTNATYGTGPYLSVGTSTPQPARIFAFKSTAASNPTEALIFGDFNAPFDGTNAGFAVQGLAINSGTHAPLNCPGGSCDPYNGHVIAGVFNSQENSGGLLTEFGVEGRADVLSTSSGQQHYSGGLVGAFKNFNGNNVQTMEGLEVVMESCNNAAVTFVTGGPGNTLNGGHYTCTSPDAHGVGMGIHITPNQGFATSYGIYDDSNVEFFGGGTQIPTTAVHSFGASNGLSSGGSGTINVGNGSATDVSGTMQGAIFNANTAMIGAGYYSSAAHIIISSTAPTVASGFNTTGTIAANPNGTASFVVTVGTGTATSIGVLTLPAATAGWNCFATNRTRADHIQQSSADSTTSVTLTNYGTGFSATNFTNSDSIQVSCFAH